MMEHPMQRSESRLCARRSFSFWCGVFVALWLIAWSQTAALAQEGGAASTAHATSFVSWFYDAEGIFFFPQLGISIGLVAIIIANFLCVRRANFVPDEFVQSFENFVKEKKFKEAFELAKKDESVLGRMVANGLPRLSVGYQEALDAMQEIGEEDDMKYEHRLSYLALIGNIATLVGLLGTVWGMVASFMEIGKSDVAPKPSVLAKGVSQALLTTIIGLLQAIPAIICFTVLKNRIARLMLDVGMIGERLLQPFKTVAVRKPTEPAQPAAAS
jgi:biopolymer transport protein ExbB